MLTLTDQRDIWPRLVDCTSGPSVARIVAKTVDMRGRPLYRIGDVLDALGRPGQQIAV